MAADLYRTQRVSGYVDLDYLLGADEWAPLEAGEERAVPVASEFPQERFEALERWITAHTAKVREDRRRWRPTGDHESVGAGA